MLSNNAESDIVIWKKNLFNKLDYNTRLENS